jgi:cobalt-zinc-cadmium efflux system outer membrane protein
MIRVTGIRRSALPAGIATMGFAFGCASGPARPGFDDVQVTAHERLGARVEWRQSSDDDRAAEHAVRDLLSHELTADAAVQIALLNNRRLQATYEDLGVTQAAVVQAGLLSNPVFSAAVSFPEGGGQSELAFGVAQSFLDVFLIPLRRRVAEAEFESARHDVAAAVIDLAAEARDAFIRHQADEELLALRRQVEETSALALEVMTGLHEAGNVRDVDLARQRVEREEAFLAADVAGLSATHSRERLNAIMGLWGSDTSWTISTRLPDATADHDWPDDVERVAIERSAALAAARARVIAAGERAGLADSTALLAAIDLGAHAEREDGHWEIGPEASLPIPLFDQGQARRAAARAELRRAMQRHAATAIEVRAAARAASDAVVRSARVASHHRVVVLPLRASIVEELQLEFNAMLIGVFDLIRARQETIEAAARSVEATRDYWLARSRLECILAGGSPDLRDRGERSATAPATAPASGGAGGH